MKEYQRKTKKNKEEILKNYKTKETGLTQKEYEERFETNGPNIVVKNKKGAGLSFL